jgi:hypothetical protein
MRSQAWSHNLVLRMLVQARDLNAIHDHPRTFLVGTRQEKDNTSVSRWFSAIAR